MRLTETTAELGRHAAASTFAVWPDERILLIYDCWHVRNLAAFSISLPRNAPPSSRSHSIPISAASPAASPCVDVTVGRSRTHRAEEDTGSDKRLISSGRFDKAKNPVDGEPR
jgi:hypothetical protein